MGDDTVQWHAKLERAARALYDHDCEIMAVLGSSTPHGFENLSADLRNDYYVTARIALEA